MGADADRLQHLNFHCGHDNNNDALEMMLRTDDVRN